MKKLLNRIETSSNASGSNIVQLPSSTLLNNNCGGNNGGGNGGSGANTSGSSSTQGNILGKTINLKKINNINVEEIIAEGGFGIVYLAKSSSVKYALKRVIVNNEIDLNVVTREIQIMTTLSHPNLLPCLDFTITSLGNNVTEALLLMPYYKNNLLNLLNQKMSVKSHLVEKEVLMILLDIISAIARLHHCTTPIVHRDIKIENVLIDETSSAASATAVSSANSSSSSSNSSESGKSVNSNKFILCDFGSATAKIWDPSVHSIQAIQDDLEKYTTLAYRAPEMVDLYSNRGTLNTKTDIWALGIFAYKICFYTTPFGDSILAIQSANLAFPSTTSYSQQLHALIYYLLNPDSNTRPDIFQCGELVSQLLKIKNPIQNLNASPSPPTFDVLINNMTTRKASSGDAVVINKSSGAAVVPLETSVTPRQRPKGNTILQAPTNGNILIIPPPKSPCKLVPEPISLSGGGHASTAANPAAVAAAIGITSTDNELKISSTHQHRRNVSDSSAFEKEHLQTNVELSATTSEQAISSWNPFEADFSSNSAGESPAAAVVTSEAGPAPGAPANSNPVNPSGNEDDDPFENAPFEYFKYQPIDLSQVDDDEICSGSHSPVDLFGAAPFSNPFLQFSSLGNGGNGANNSGVRGIPPPPSSSSSTTSSKGSRGGGGNKIKGTNSTVARIDGTDSSNNSTTNDFLAQSSTQPPVLPQKRQPKLLGVTNLSFED